MNIALLAARRKLPFSDAINSFLDKNPLVCALLFFGLAAVLAYFGYRAIRERVSKDKRGRVLEGNAAVRNGYILMVFAFFSFCAGGYQVIKGVSQGGRGGFARPNIPGGPRLPDGTRSSGDGAPPSAMKGFDVPDHLVATPYVGKRAVSKMTQSGGIMVGMVVTTTSDGNLSSMVPIFQVGSQRSAVYEMGQRGANSTLLLADPGKAVAQVNVRGTSEVEAIQLEFSSFDQEGTAVGARDLSEWIGNSTLPESSQPTNQKLIGGINGEGNADLPGFGFELLNYRNPDRSVVEMVEMKGTSVSAAGILAQVRSGVRPTGGERRSRMPDVAESLARNGNPPSQSAFSEDLQAEVEEHQNQVQREIAQSQQNMADAAARMKERLESQFPNRRGGTPDLDAMQRPNRDLASTPGNSGGSDMPSDGTGSGETESDPEAGIAAGKASDLGVAEIALPPLRYDLKKAQQSEYVGFPLKGVEFLAHGPEGSALVGLRVGVTNRAAGEIQSIRPIYQQGDSYFYGERIGAAGGTMETLLARPGYLVGGCRLRGGVALRSVQLLFVKFDPETGRLDEEDKYPSDNLGSSNGPSEELYSNGWHVVGLFGRADEGVLGMGLAALKAARDPRAAKTTKPEVRTWTSSDGKFSVDATFVRQEGGTVELLKENGESVNVPLERLSDADKTWLRDRQ